MSCTNLFIIFFQTLDGLKTRAKRTYLDKIKYLGGTGGGPSPSFHDPALKLSNVHKRVLALMDTVQIFGRDDVPDPLQVLCVRNLLFGMACNFL